MKPTLGEELRIFVFEGDRVEIKTQVDNWMEGAGTVFEVVDIHYNYQGPEYDGRVVITPDGSHGVLIVARQLTCNELRQQRGLPPLPEKEVQHGTTQEGPRFRAHCC